VQAFDVGTETGYQSTEEKIERPATSYVTCTPENAAPEA